MGLREAHRILVVAAIAASAIVMVWALAVGRGGGMPALGAGSGAVLVGLVLYLRWFVKKGLTGRRPA